MFIRKNLLPALAFAAALAPFAANAWTGQLSGQSAQAVHQTVVPLSGGQVASGASPGRPGEFNHPTGNTLTQPEYAASGAQAEDPNNLF